MSLSDDRKNRVILPSADDWTPFPLPAPLRMNPGCCLVVMDGAVEASGQFELPPEVGGHLMPNSGTIVAVGPDQRRRIGTCPAVRMEVAVGDRVLVLPFEGVRWRTLAFREHGWGARDVRVFGGVVGDLPINIRPGRLISGQVTVFDHEPYHVAVLSKVMNDSLRPIGDWMLIRRDSIRDARSGLFMSESTRGVNSLGNWKATVVVASQMAMENGYLPGSRCLYHAPSSLVTIDGVHGNNFGLEGDIEEYAFIRWTQCYGVVLPTDEADFEAIDRAMGVAVLQDPDTGRLVESGAM